jgi:amino acid transporter
MVFGRRKKSTDRVENRHGRNWMSAMGILFIVMAVIIALRNLYFFTTQLSIWFYIDNYTNGQITNEKFVIAMVVAGGILLYWGYFKKNNEDSARDEYESRRFNYGM